MKILTALRRPVTKEYPAMTQAICAECGHPIPAVNPVAEAAMNAYPGHDLLHRHCRQLREAREGRR